MKKFEKKNDRIGSDVLKASMLTSDEIENIVTAPHLFDSVKAAIRSEQKVERSVWMWKKPVIAVAVFAVFTIGAFGLISFAKRQYYVSSDAVINAQNQVEPIVVPQPVQVIQPRIEDYQTQNPTVVKAVARQINKGKPAVRTVKKEQPGRRIEEVSDFYALTYMGDADETDDDQIVRVELPRSSLFAMGINVPVENEVFKVKADLLVGSDGVMKAVRLVR